MVSDEAETALEPARNRRMHQVGNGFVVLIVVSQLRFINTKLRREMVL